MSKKAGLLSIGDVSKYTGVGKKALRYYERIGILRPAYVDPDSLYRYYSFNQTTLVFFISYAVELDIPLKELSAFVGEEGKMDLKSFLAYGKEVSAKKIKTLENGLKSIELFEEKMHLQERYPMHEIYTRKLPQQYCYVLPYEKSFDTADPYQFVNLFNEASISEEEYGNELLDYGFLCKYNGKTLERYAFVELPEGFAFKECAIIPAGEFICRQSDVSQIEHTFEIFKDYLDGKSPFIAIETEVFSGGKFDINTPINELRVLVL